MNKNSINEVAKTYQRLVESAPPEASVSASINPEPNLETSPKPINLDPGNFSETFNRIADDNMRRLLQRIISCYELGCSQEEINNLMQQYYRWLLRDYGPYS